MTETLQYADAPEEIIASIEYLKNRGFKHIDLRKVVSEGSSINPNKLIFESSGWHILKDGCSPLGIPVLPYDLVEIYISGLDDGETGNNMVFDALFSGMRTVLKSNNPITRAVEYYRSENGLTYYVE
ncbi:hypothetical protein M0R04_01740 [Candidatus Dojkabacteria bacterium]|jgi:hypothetical protein|nr:hypothetical protein [Candidatus Dojkabacteria bacterium]